MYKIFRGVKVAAQFSHIAFLADCLLLIDGPEQVFLIIIPRGAKTAPSSQRVNSGEQKISSRFSLALGY